MLCKKTSQRSRTHSPERERSLTGLKPALGNWKQSSPGTKLVFSDHSVIPPAAPQKVLTRALPNNVVIIQEPPSSDTYKDIPDCLKLPYLSRQAFLFS